MKAALAALGAWWHRHPSGATRVLLIISTVAAPCLVLAALWIPDIAVAPALVLIAAVLLLRFTPDDDEDESDGAQ